ncbi:hypothetical protein BVY03_06140 [bacterium K02(2017)]|nr:hypothetical protein BVY03_06140 [bacterium K02(2017)]
MEYDLAIIGKGFAGLSALHLALKAKLKTAIIYHDNGASQHFSGAFDLIDPRLNNYKIKSDNLPRLHEALKTFIKANPQHLYANINNQQPQLIEEVAKHYKDFFEFYKISIELNDKLFSVMGPSGNIKPTAASLPSFAIKNEDLKTFKNAVYIHIPFLKDYQPKNILKNLNLNFDTSIILNWDYQGLNPQAGLINLLHLMDQKQTFEAFKIFLKENIKPNQVVFIPPILGLKNYHSNLQEISQQLNIKIIELLSCLPSPAGLRIQNPIESRLNNLQNEHQLDLIQDQVVGFNAQNNCIESINLKNQKQPIQAKQYVLATGKYIGGGIKKSPHPHEAIFNLPLYGNKRQKIVTSNYFNHIDQNALSQQKFLNLGIDPKPDEFNNLKSCGQIQYGFDAFRERCAFGVTLLSSHYCLDFSKNPA